MGRGRARAKQSKANREVKFPGTRSPQRETVTVDQTSTDRGDGPDSDGSAGVREPRHPKPKPLSSAGARPMPPPEFVYAASSTDPRY